jgi:EAL domain-containing protein (putative c-di-GMP-specific phosphodiesterase class I)
MNYLQRFLSARFLNKEPQVSELLGSKNLEVAFQPLVTLQDGTIASYEALARVSQTVPFNGAQALFEAAKLQKQHTQLELAYIQLAIDQWARKTDGTHLSLNITASSLVRMERGPEDGALLQLLDNCRLPSRVLSVEITHLHKGIPGADLATAIGKLRREEIAITFDDFKCTESHMKLWAKLTPGVVKMDMGLTRGISADPLKQKRVRALVALSRRYGSLLAAKGVESADDVYALCEAGVDFGQGYFLGSPDVKPIDGLNMRARQALQSGWVPLDVTMGSTPQPPMAMRH